MEDGFQTDALKRFPFGVLSSFFLPKRKYCHFAKLFDVKPCTSILPVGIVVKVEVSSFYDFLAVGNFSAKNSMISLSMISKSTQRKQCHKRVCIVLVFVLFGAVNKILKRLINRVLGTIYRFSVDFPLWTGSKAIRPMLVPKRNCQKSGMVFYVERWCHFFSVANLLRDENKNPYSIDSLVDVPYQLTMG